MCSRTPDNDISFPGTLNLLPKITMINISIPGNFSTFQKTEGRYINLRGRFIEEYDGRIVDEFQCYRQSLVLTT